MATNFFDFASAQATLGVVADGLLQADEVAATLRVPPAEGFLKGETHTTHSGGSIIRQSSYWKVPSPLTDSASVDAHVRSLLALVDTDSDAIDSLSRRFDAEVTISCTWEGVERRGGFVVIADTIRSLATKHIGLHFAFFPPAQFWPDPARSARLEDESGECALYDAFISLSFSRESHFKAFMSSVVDRGTWERHHDPATPGRLQVRCPPLPRRRKIGTIESLVGTMMQSLEREAFSEPLRRVPGLAWRLHVIWQSQYGGDSFSIPWPILHRMVPWNMELLLEYRVPDDWIRLAPTG